MAVTDDGGFTLEWRTYRWCGQGPPPCDQQANSVITDGGRAIGRLEPMSATTATGRVTITNDPSAVPAGAFLVDVSEYQVLTLHFATATMTLCGPKFPSLAPAAVISTQPCG
jgi:hypothetical protein